MRLCGALVWIGVSLCAWWTARPAAAEEAALLPTLECRLEHPLRLSSIAARCGILRVPIDREHPKGGFIDLKIAVVPALNFARINRNHAIVLLDQRGTGNSDQQSCVYPEDWQEPADPLPALRKATADCLAKLGAHVRFYTTSIAVRDLDAVRQALGYDLIDLYGGSYGTRVAELYMRRYPAHVHAVILDGVTYPQQAIGVETPQDAERALNLIVARCVQTSDCAATYPQLQDDLNLLLRQFGPQRGLVTIDDPNSGLPLEFDFSRRIFNAALRLLSYSSMQGRWRLNP